MRPCLNIRSTDSLEPAESDKATSAKVQFVVNLCSGGFRPPSYLQNAQSDVSEHKCLTYTRNKMPVAGSQTIYPLSTGGRTENGVLIKRVIPGTFESYPRLLIEAIHMAT